MTVVCGEETAPPAREDVARARGGSVQGFPLGHYGPGALDDALGGAGAKMPRPDEAERTETEIAGRAAARSNVFT